MFFRLYWLEATEDILSYFARFKFNKTITNKISIYCYIELKEWFIREFQCFGSLKLPCFLNFKKYILFAGFYIFIDNLFDKIKN